MLSADEAQLLGDMYLLREGEEHGRELWAAVADEMFASAARLWAAGRLDRKWDEGELVYRASDRLMSAQRTHAAIASASARTN